MQRKYRRSLSASQNLSHTTSQRSSMSPYQKWQHINPQGPHRSSSNPAPARYHPYVHHPRTPPATPDRVKPQMSPQSLPPLVIPTHRAPSAHSPFSAPNLSSPRSIGSDHPSNKLLPDIHTAFASPSLSPLNLQLPPIQPTWTRSFSEPGYTSSRPSPPASPTPSVTHDISEQVKNRMRLDALLS